MGEGTMWLTWRQIASSFFSVCLTISICDKMPLHRGKRDSGPIGRHRSRSGDREVDIVIGVDQERDVDIGVDLGVQRQT